MAWQKPNAALAGSMLMIHIHNVPATPVIHLNYGCEAVTRLMCAGVQRGPGCSHYYDFLTRLN